MPPEDLNIVTKNGMAIQNISNPSNEVQLAAITQNPYAITRIKKEICTEEAKILAVSKEPFLITYISNPSEEVMLAAVRRNGCALFNILQYNPSPRVLQEAVKQNPNLKI